MKNKKVNWMDEAILAAFDYGYMACAAAQPPDKARKNFIKLINIKPK